MALVSFGYRVDMYAITPPTDPAGYIVAYDLDGVLKQKNHLGVVSLVGSGAGGPQGIPGPVGPAGLTWSGLWSATSSYSMNYAVGYASASWWCISDVTGATGNDSPDMDTIHWTLLAAQGSPGPQGGQGEHGLDGPRGLTGATGFMGATGPRGVTGATGPSGNFATSSFYIQGGTIYSYDTTSNVYRTGALNIGSGVVSGLDTRFVVSSSTGTVSLVVSEDGSVYNGNGNSVKFGFQALYSSNNYATFNTAIGLQSLYSNKTGSWNIAIGEQTLYSATSSNYNIAIGSLSMYSNTTGYYNTAIGYNSLFSNTTGFQNTAIGDYSLSSNITGFQNTALGISSLYSNTIGVDNTAIGCASLYFNIEGSSNIAIGTSALYSATSSSNNIAIGYGSLANNTNTLSLQPNVAVGHSSLINNTTGFKNTAIGYQSLYLNTTGYYNIALGQDSLYSNTTGTINVAIGTETLYSNTTGDVNIAIAQGALYNNLTGSENIAIGLGSLFFATSSSGNIAIGIDTLASNDGSNNIAIGNNAGYIPGVTTSSNNSVFIGTETISNGDNNATNEIVIGYSATGNGSNSVTLGNDSILKTYLKGSVLIGSGTATDGRFVVSSTVGKVSLVLNEQGDAIFSGDTKISGQTFSNLPPGSITFGSKTAIYSPNDAEIVIGADRLATYNYNYGWKFTGYQITNLWNNAIEFQNPIGTIGNLWIGSNYVFAGYGVPVSQQSTLFVKGTTSSIMKVVGTGATSSNSDSIFSIEDSGKVSIGSGNSSSTDRFVVSSLGGTVSLVVSENGSIYNGSLFDLKYGYNSLPSFGKLPIDEYGDLNNGSGYTPGYYTASTSLVYGSYTLNVYPVVHIYVDGLGEAYLQSVVSIGSGWLDDGHSMVFTADIPGGSDYSFYLYLLPGFNTAIGNYSLSSNTTGSYNMAFGHKSLYTNTTGEASIAIGNYSLFSNISGGDNIALGFYSLYHNNSGGDNIALGVYSLYNNTVGSGNMAIGNALFENTTGNSNIAIGEQSLRENTIGSYNIGLGENSLYNNKIGNYNIAIGNDSGSQTVVGIFATISNNSIFIGRDTRPQLNDQTNQIVIGYGATGNGSNTVTLGADTITRTYLKGKVVIADGTQASGYVLTSDANGLASWTASSSVSYKVYTALLTQSSTSAPTAIVLENTLGVTVTYAYSITGEYIGTATGSLTLNKTALLIKNSAHSSPNYYTESIARISTDLFVIGSQINGVFTNGILNQTTIEIRVYN